MKRKAHRHFLLSSHARCISMSRRRTREKEKKRNNLLILFLEQADGPSETKAQGARETKETRRGGYSKVTVPKDKQGMQMLR